MKKNKIVILSIASALIICAIVIGFNFGQKVQYAEGIYNSLSIESLDKKEVVEEIELTIEEVDIEDFSKNERELLFNPTYDKQTWYLLTFKEKIDGKWHSYLMSNALNKRKEVIFVSTEKDKLAVHMKIKTEFFSSTISGFDISVTKNFINVYNAKLRIKNSVL